MSKTFRCKSQVCVKYCKHEQLNETLCTQLIFSYLLVTVKYDHFIFKVSSFKLHINGIGYIRRLISSYILPFF